MNVVLESVCRYKICYFCTSYHNTWAYTDTARSRHTSHAIAEALIHLFLCYFRRHPLSHSSLGTFQRTWNSSMFVLSYNERLAFHTGNVGGIRATDIAMSRQKQLGIFATQDTYNLTAENHFIQSRSTTVNTIKLQKSCT